MAAAALLGLSGCAQSPSVLSPASEPAQRLALLGWWLLSVAVAVVLIVAALVLLPLRRRRASLADTELSRGGGTWAVVVGAAVSTVILTAAFVFTILVLGATSSPPAKAALTVEVIGHQWWWEVRYPGSGPGRGAVTANEVHIPVGRPVRLRVQSADVIHSFWVPELQGKIDLIPGQTNVFWIQAARPGRYRGQCAEYCGLQHANMALFVTADPPDRFQGWLERERRPAGEPADTLARRGAELFTIGAGCAMCHAVRGTRAAQGRFALPAPDLTHVGSRGTLGAGTVPNTPGNLAAWIRNAPALKPGVKMPEMQVDASDLKAIVAYLEGLK